MFKIVAKESLNPTVSKMVIDAPAIAKKAEPGQFIILRVDEDGERIPLTIADFDRENGTVTIIYQIVGGTTKALDAKKEGEYICDFVGPLGKATETDGIKRLPLSAAVLAVRSRSPLQRSSTSSARRFIRLSASVTRISLFFRTNLPNTAINISL